MTVPAAAKKILDFIGSKEAPHGYDTVYGNNQARMPRQITSMTIAQVIADGRRRTKAYGSSAAGRYQFMPPTLRALVSAGAAPANAVMTAEVQDTLGHALLVKRGLNKFLSGSMTLRAFGLGLAQEWASFPVLGAMKGAHREIERGQSYYAGDGLNKALVSASEVEAVLRYVKTGSLKRPSSPSEASAAAEPAASPPEVGMVSSAAVASPSPWWHRLVGIKPPAAIDPRPGLAPNGDPALWDIQSKLKRFGYEPIITDGLNGPRTRAQVRAARERNGLPPGDQIDAAFTASLPGMLPAEISETRAVTPDHEVKAMAPDLFAPLKGLAPAGLGTVAVSTLGAASDAGIMDKAKDALDSVTATAGSLQQGMGVLFGIGQWVYAHPWIIGLAIGGYVLIRATVGTLKIIALWRQARAS